MLSFDGRCSTEGFNHITPSQQASILFKHLKAVHRIHRQRRIRMSTVRDLVITRYVSVIRNACLTTAARRR